jgi:hypothetical protein
MMDRKHLTLALALALAVGALAHALCGSLVAPRTVQERAFDSDWEYCAVVKAQYPGSVRFVYWITYFRGEGVRTENVETEPGGNPFAKAVAKLGQDGWEMVGEGPLEIRPGAPGGTQTAIFFKRPRG